ncbi:hypothetical protein ACIPEN_22300 [Herbaspirillum chlorophenolicum]|uniref:Uncharacterized protein n=1 Tax=Herbaspirillum chlorophenolicum TaxID=211589 RepID=A0ABW8F5N0_9BURK
MRDYGKVSPKFWTGSTGKALRGQHEAQIVAFYLMTCPTSEMTGVFDCPMLYIAHETGLGMEGASKGLQRLIEGDFCTYDEASEVVFVHEMAKWQIGETLKVNDNQVKSVQKAFKAMPDGLKQAFYERYSEAFHLPLASPLQAPSKPRTGTRERTGAGTRTDSVPDGTGGEPPSEEGQSGKTADQLTKDELWKAGKSLLSAQGMPAAQCGTFVGKLVKDYGNEIVVDAVRAAVVERPADAASFLKAACMARKKEGGKSLIPWHATDKGVEEKGLELDPPLRPNPGESAISFKTRVIAAVENGGKAPVAPRSTVTGPTVDDGPRRLKPEGIAPLASLVKPRAAA